MFCRHSEKTAVTCSNAQRHFAADLAAGRKRFPDETSGHVRESYCGMGTGVWYEAQRPLRQSPDSQPSVLALASTDARPLFLVGKDKRATTARDVRANEECNAPDGEATHRMSSLGPMTERWRQDESHRKQSTDQRRCRRTGLHERQ